MKPLTEIREGLPMTAALALAALSALIAFLVYIPALSNGFVNWDDPTYVLENAHIRSLSPGFFKFAFTSFYFSNWHPLTLISYAVFCLQKNQAPRRYPLVHHN